MLGFFKVWHYFRFIFHNKIINIMHIVKNTLILFALFAISFGLFAQNSDQIKDSTEMFRTKTNYKILYYMVVDKDSIPIYQIDEVVVRPLTDSDEMERFKKLRRNIIKVMPYAKLAAFKLQLMEDNLAKIEKKKDRKKYIKQSEKAIKEEFMKELQNLTMSQGKLLLKLIHRETGKTTFDIMSNYSGGLETVFWQAMAKTYNTSMKETFDPVNDWEIDFIIKKLELE